MYPKGLSTHSTARMGMVTPARCCLLILAQKTPGETAANVNDQIQQENMEGRGANTRVYGRHKLKGMRLCCTVLAACSGICVLLSQRRKRALRINNRVKFQVERVHKATKGRDKKSPQETHYGGI